MSDKPNAGGDMRADTETAQGDKKGFTGVWIPRFLYELPDLKPADREVLAIIHSLSQGGFVCVDYVAQVRRVNRSSQSTHITRLEERGYLKRVFIAKGKANQVVLTDKAKSPEQYPLGKPNTPLSGKPNTPCQVNRTPPVSQTEHNNKEIIKEIEKGIVNTEYPEVRLSIGQPTMRFIELWKLAAESDEWPVKITASGSHPIEYFGDEIKARINRLLETRSPAELIDDIKHAVGYLIEDTHDWAAAEVQDEEYGHEFNIAWHLNALDDNEDRSRWQAKERVNHGAHLATEPTGESVSASNNVPASSEARVNQGASPLLRYAQPPISSKEEIKKFEQFIKQKAVNTKRELSEQELKRLNDLRKKAQEGQQQ